MKKNVVLFYFALLLQSVLVINPPVVWILLMLMSINCFLCFHKPSDALIYTFFWFLSSWYESYGQSKQSALLEFPILQMSHKIVH